MFGPAHVLRKMCFGVFFETYGVCKVALHFFTAKILEQKNITTQTNDIMRCPTFCLPGKRIYVLEVNTSLNILKKLPQLNRLHLVLN